MVEAVDALQNHPGDVEYPVRSRRRYTRALEAKRKADPAEMRRRALPVTLIAAPFGIAAFTPTFAELPQELRAKHRDGEEGAPWFALPVASLKQLRSAFDEQFKIVTKADAERLLEPLAEKAFATYRSWDEYWREVVIATAFRTDSLQAVQSQCDALADLRTTPWPAASVTWPMGGATA